MSVDLYISYPNEKRDCEYLRQLIFFKRTPLPMIIYYIVDLDRRRSIGNSSRDVKFLSEVRGFDVQFTQPVLKVDSCNSR